MQDLREEDEKQKKRARNRTLCHSLYYFRMPFARAQRLGSLYFLERIRKQQYNLMVVDNE